MSASGGVDAVVQRTTATAPLFDFTAVDGVQHTIWRVTAHDERELIAAFGAMPALYIADGHHRAASAARARQQLKQGAATGEWDTFLAVAFPGDQMQILPYNRVVKDLGSLHARVAAGGASRAFDASSRARRRRRARARWRCSWAARGTRLR